MAFQNPIVAYTAKSEVEAYLVCDILRNEGIKATVVEDVSQAGVWIGGFVGAIYKPQVWIERTDAERAGALVHEYERRAAERWAAERAPLVGGASRRDVREVRPAGRVSGGAAGHGAELPALPGLRRRRRRCRVRGMG